MKVRKVFYLEPEHEKALAKQAEQESKESKDRVGFESKIIRELIETLPTFKKA